MVRKQSKKRSVTKRQRKHRGGYYGATGAIAPGAMEWSRGSEAGAYAAGLNDRGGNSFQLGAGKRRRHSRKHRKSRKARRGGGSYGAVSAQYTGHGSRGIADYIAVDTKNGSGAPQLGAFNDNGAKPGQFDSFKGVRPL